MDSPDSFWFKATLKYIILAKNGDSISSVTKKLGMTYSHVNDKTVELNKRGIIELSRNGREKNIVFTEKGREVKKLLEAVDDLMFPKNKKGEGDEK